MQVGFWDTLASGVSNAASKVNWGDVATSAGGALINARSSAQIAKINAKAQKIQNSGMDYIPQSRRPKALPAQPLLSQNAILFLAAIGIGGAIFIAVKMSAKKAGQK